MFHALHKVDMRACYAKQKINLDCPNMELFFQFKFKMAVHAALTKKKIGKVKNFCYFF